MVTVSLLLLSIMLRVALEHEKEVNGIQKGKEVEVSLFTGS